MASSWRDHAVTLAWACIFILLPALVAWHDGGARLSHGIPRQAQGHGRLPPPMVEPQEMLRLGPDEARARNAALPFSTKPNPPARPYHFTGSHEDRERAIACLAAAQIYEAGDDPVGQRAVAQVVLNRVRHPAFPKTVCEVVFQGAERSTGCQFTFTCDGAMSRHPPAAAWDRARALADRMLDGDVYRPVGLATHYHTDWVVPYWSDSLDKVAAVQGHLFFSWRGYWGTRAAFGRNGETEEPAIARLAFLSPLHANAAATGTANGSTADAVGGDATQLALAPQIYSLSGETPVSGTLPKGVHLVATSPTQDAFVLEIPASLPDSQYAQIARTFCSGRNPCRVMAWQKRTGTAGTGAPASFPLQATDLRRMRFSYIHNADSGLQRMLWNCDLATPPSGGRCMKERLPVSALATPAKPGSINP